MALESVRTDTKGCCQSETTFPSVIPERWMSKVDMICRLAIGIFSYVISPLYFSFAFVLGAALGAGYALSRYWQSKPLAGPDSNMPICAQGFMTFLSKRKFSIEINTVVTALFIGAHVRHDPTFFVPFTALFLGFWVGNECSDLLRDLGGRTFREYQSKA